MANSSSSSSKKSTATKGRKTSGGTKASGGKKTASQRPVRREVTGVVLLVLTLCVGVGYFGDSAIFINWLAALLRGMLGYGYYLAAPALLLAALILLFHHGRPVQLRVTCTLLLPVLFGTLGHMVLCRQEFESSFGVLKALWTGGRAMESGGVLSGALAVGSLALLGKIASIIIFTALFAILAMVAFHLTLGAVLEKARNRPQYEEEERKPAVRVTAPESSAPKQKPVIDIPLDSDQGPEKKPGLLSGFFRQKSEQTKTPDQLLIEQAEPPAAPPVEPSIIIDAATAVPSPDPVPPQDPVPASESSAASREERKATPSYAPESKRKVAAELADAAAAVTREIEERSAGSGGAYQYPSLTLLNENRGGSFAEAGAELRNNARRLSETLTSFGVDAKPGEVIHGPSVTRYEFVLDQGVKLSKLTNLSDDIALALGASGVRIAPIPDKLSVVGIEVPNKQVTPVLIRDVLGSQAFSSHKSRVAFAVGKDIGGNCVVGNIARLPHVLIAGTTGSGKSVCTNSLIVSLLYKSSPEDVRFIMVDPKMVELAPYNGIPHLLIPVVTDPKKAAGALQWAVYEMMNRYRLFSEHNVKDLEGYNALARTSGGELNHMASVVVVIDELADLMLVAAKEVEESICRVAQMGRAAGMHLVIATQRPSADVITGLMKANIPSRIAFAVASSLESRIILDTTGAEKLVGKGDMLYAPLGVGKPVRVQGCFITPGEIERVVEFVKKTGEVRYDDEVIAKIEQSVQEKEKKGAPEAAEPAADEADELFPAAVEVVLETGQASVSMLQRRLKLGYSRAARLVDQMERQGVVGPFEGSKPRQLLITKEQWQEQKLGGGTLKSAAPPEDGVDS